MLVLINNESIFPIEKDIIENVLLETGYTVLGKIEAAKKLGISESTLYRRIKELNIKQN